MAGLPKPPRLAALSHLAANLNVTVESIFSIILEYQSTLEDGVSECAHLNVII